MTPSNEPLTIAKQYIDRHFDQPLVLNQIAQQAAYSPYHFLRSFRAQFDETPHAYLTRLRMLRARELLTTTDLPVTDVCFAVGYESLGSFSTSFRRQVGHSPHHYRARVFQSVELVKTAPRYIPFCFVYMMGASGTMPR